MGEAMETNKTEAMTKNKSASVFFRVLKGLVVFSYLIVINACYCSLPKHAMANPVAAFPHY